MNELQGFVLEGQGIRGALVRLEETWRQVIAEHRYAPPVRTLLGEAVAATVLLASGLKAQPSVSLQLQGEGPLKLLVVQCADSLRVRAVAHCSAEPQAAPLLGPGRLVVNVDTGKPNGFFQGIVPLTSSKLDECLEGYFMQSEQLATRIVLASDDERAAGLLLQILPGHREERATEAFGEAVASLRSLSAAELRSAAAEALLPRLFARHEIRLFEPRAVLHDCRCTPERLAGVVRMLGADELESLLAEQGIVELTCEFCNRAFRYDERAVDTILRGGTQSSVLH